jgi:phosphoesterase RecJ-like protein|tara:strand:+ start:740 stop:1741 length:1002 start_codon:yes stop_codon:yes gene_type:complete
MNLNRYKPIIENINRVALSTHENPDGDGLGCAAAMYHFYKNKNIDCKIILPTSLPHEFEFLEKGSMFYLYSSETMDSWLKDVDLIIIFDVGDINRLRDIRGAIQKYNLPSLNIDHHTLVDGSLFTYNLVDTHAAATGEIVFDILEQCFSIDFTKDICEGIFSAIMTDTGSFRYSNTNIHCHEIAIECYKAGVDTSYIYQQVYENTTKSRVKLLGTVLHQIHYELDGELAWFIVDNTMMEQCEADKTDVEGFSDFVRTINGVEVALMIMESGKNKCKMNFRSKGKYIVNDIANTLGGGGHPFASGAKIQGSIEKATPHILDVVRKSIVSQQGVK